MTEDDAGHFDRIADRYDDARPRYPAALWAVLEDAGVLFPGVRVLELGAGSGQATRELVARGAVVDAVEPGPALAAALGATVPSVTVHHARAEDLDLAPAGYDSVVAATAWHWIDAPATLPLLHRTLRPGGALAVWWNVFGDEPCGRPSGTGWSGSPERSASPGEGRSTPCRPMSGGPSSRPAGCSAAGAGRAALAGRSHAGATARALRELSDLGPDARCGRPDRQPPPRSAAPWSPSTT